MPEIKAWKSEEDGKLFEDKDSYLRHLRKLVKLRRERQTLDRIVEEREQFLDRMGLVTSLGELEQFVKDNWDWFCRNGAAQRGSRAKTPHQLVCLSISNPRWIEELPNTHSAPRGRDRYYDRFPAWSARISYTVESKSGGFGSDYFRNTPINTETGGGDYSNYGYDITLWAADFPNLKI